MGPGVAVGPAGENRRLFEMRLHPPVAPGTPPGWREPRKPSLGFGDAGGLASGIPMIPIAGPASRRRPDMELLGLPFHSVGVEQVLAFIEDTVAKNQKAIALNLNVYCVNLALKYRWLHEFIQSANLVFCDGDGVRLGLKLLGYAPPPKITYNEWLWQLAAFCEAKKYRLYFLGGKPGVAEEAAGNLKARYPTLNVVGIQHGFFNKQGEENQRVVDSINGTSPDILLVCFGM